MEDRFHPRVLDGGRRVESKIGYDTVRASHSESAYVSKTAYLDGGQERLEMLEEMLDNKKLGRKDYEIEKKRLETLFRNPEDMTETELRSELRKRKLYRKGIKRDVLVCVLTEAFRKESRCMRLFDEVKLALIAGGSSEHPNSIPEVLKIARETRGRHNRVMSRFAAPKKSARDVTVGKPRELYLSLPQLDASFESGSQQNLDNAIFLFDLRREDLFSFPPGKTFLKDRFDARYCLCSSERLFEVLWRAEETGRVHFFRKAKKKIIAANNTTVPTGTRWERVSSWLHALENPVTGKPFEELQLKPHWWRLYWGQTAHPCTYTRSAEKIKLAMMRGNFDLATAAEILYHSQSAGSLKIHGVMPLEERDAERVRRRRRLRNLDGSAIDDNAAEAAQKALVREVRLAKRGGGGGGGSRSSSSGSSSGSGRGSGTRS
eukprot:g5116.t1